MFRRWWITVDAAATRGQTCLMGETPVDTLLTDRRQTKTRGLGVHGGKITRCNGGVQAYSCVPGSTDTINNTSKNSSCETRKTTHTLR